VAFALGWLFHQPVLEMLFWRSWDLALGVAVAVPMLGVFWILMHAPSTRFQAIRRFVDEVLRPLFSAYTTAELAVLAACAGVTEEMLFRGVLQPALGRWLTPWAGVVLASVVFGLLHPISRLYVAVAILFGLYLGGLVLATGNLLGVMVAHGVYDFVVLLYVVHGPRSRSFPR
jgi:uncharacterized protein